MRTMEELQRYAVVSCHVERPLDDAVWRAFERLLERRPAGFVVTPLLRPPHAASGEDEERWLERARRAAELAPLGHHTHWGGPTQARPEGDADAAAVVRGEAETRRQILIYSILLYAGNHPVFVVDAYTHRIFGRHGVTSGKPDYEAVRARFETALPRHPQFLNEFHALIVNTGKNWCRKEDSNP